METGSHIRLVLWKTAKAVERVDRDSIRKTGLSLSDFTIMEAATAADRAAGGGTGRGQGRIPLLKPKDAQKKWRGSIPAIHYFLACGHSDQPWTSSLTPTAIL
jgi:hypothetical protein